MNRVYCYHAGKNAASGRVMQKAGMKQAGIVKKGVFVMPAFSMK